MWDPYHAFSSYINNLILGLQCSSEGIDVSSLTFTATLELRQQ